MKRKDGEPSFIHLLFEWDPDHFTTIINVPMVKVGLRYSTAGGFTTKWLGIGLRPFCVTWNSRWLIKPRIA